MKILNLINGKWRQTIILLRGGIVYQTGPVSPLGWHKEWGVEKQSYQLLFKLANKDFLNWESQIKKPETLER